MPLTSRQRILRLFEGQEIDRVPIWLLAPFHRLEVYADLYNLPAYRPVVEAIARHCETFDRRRPDMGFCYNANPELRTEPIDQPDMAGTAVRWREHVFTRHVSRGQQRRRVKFFVEEPEQLEEILGIPYVPPRPPLDVLRREKAELGERGVLMMDLGDPLEPLYHLCAAQDFSMWSLTDRELLLRFTDEMYARVYDLYKYHLEGDVADAYFIVGAEFAGPPLVSPAQFNELCARYVRGIVELIRGYGKHSIVHYHGNLAMVLDGIKGIGCDALHTVEAPPIGDCTLTMAREALGDMILIGNLQYDELARREPDEIDAMVREILAEARGGRFILSPTAGPYDPNPSERLIQNYLAFIRAGIRYGGLDA